MTNDEKFLNMTIEERAEFLASQRFFGMGKAYVLYWLEAEAQKNAIRNKTKEGRKNHERLLRTGSRKA